MRDNLIEEGKGVFYMENACAEVNEIFEGMWSSFQICVEEKVYKKLNLPSGANFYDYVNVGKIWDLTFLAIILSNMHVMKIPEEEVNEFFSLFPSGKKTKKFLEKFLKEFHLDYHFISFSVVADEVIAQEVKDPEMQEEKINDLFFNFLISKGAPILKRSQLKLVNS